MTEDGEQGNEEGQRVEHRDRDHDGTGEAHRRQEGALEEQHRAQPDRDRDPGEGHGTPGGPHGGDQRLFDDLAGGQFLAEAVDDEERVVDRHAQADQGDDVGGIGRDIGDMGEQADSGEAADDRERADAEGQRRAHKCRKDNEQQGQDEEERDQLRTLEVGLQVFVELVSDGDIAGAEHLQLI